MTTIGLHKSSIDTSLVFAISPQSSLCGVQVCMRLASAKLTTLAVCIACPTNDRQLS